MSMSANYAGMVAVAFLLGFTQTACNSGARGTDDTAAAPIDSAPRDTATAPIEAAQSDSTVATQPTPPPPSEAQRDTPPAGAAQPSGQAAGGGGPKVSQIEYEGWRQYSVNCARCHGQDVLPNPVAANLLVSLAPGGPMATSETFFQVVNEGRPERGMPAFKSIMTPDQIKATYAYVKGRAEKRIPAGRPASPPT